MRDAFSFYKSFDDVYQKLNDKQKLEYMSKILDIQFLRVRIEDVVFEDSLLEFIFSGQKYSFEKSIKGYLDSQRSKKVRNPYFGCYDPEAPPSSTPSEGHRQEEKGKGQGKEKEKEKVQEQYSDKPFIENVNRINDEKKILSKSGVEEFCSYWSEHNQTTGKMKWQEQEHFDVQKRMSRWAKNNYSGNAKPTKNGDRPEMRNLAY